MPCLLSRMSALSPPSKKIPQGLRPKSVPLWCHEKDPFPCCTLPSLNSSPRAGKAVLQLLQPLPNARAQRAPHVRRTALRSVQTGLAGGKRIISHSHQGSSEDWSVAQWKSTGLKFTSDSQSGPGYSHSGRVLY